MALGSNLFKDSKRLAQCEVNNTAHVAPGDRGDHVRLIQIALGEIEDATIDPSELSQMQYGASTARAVLAYKTKRRIINFSYQTSPDNIVGKMTICVAGQGHAVLAEHTSPRGVQAMSPPRRVGR